MPSQDRVRREQGANLLELFATEDIAFDCQTTSLVIGLARYAPCRTSIENDILSAKVLNDVLLLSIDPTGKNDQHQLPRLKKEFHRRLGGSENPRGSLVRNEM